MTNSHCISHVKSTKWEQLSEWSASAGFVCSETVPIISWIIWHDLERWQYTVTTLFLLNSFLVWSKGSTRKTFWKLIYKFIWPVWRSEKTTNRYILNRVRNCIMEWMRSCTLFLVPLSASCHCILQLYSARSVQSAVHVSIANRSSKHSWCIYYLKKIIIKKK